MHNENKFVSFKSMTNLNIYVYFTTKVDMTENIKYSIKYKKQNANYRLLDREGEK